MKNIHIWKIYLHTVEYVCYFNFQFSLHILNVRQKIGPATLLNYFFFLLLAYLICFTALICAEQRLNQNLIARKGHVIHQNTNSKDSNATDVYDFH